jgi:predicted RNA-binding protein with RPS1 domain
MAPPYHDRGGAGKIDHPPPVDSIERGEVVRIEDYGAFVQLERYRGMRGLVHISQIASTRLEQVTDAVSVQDTVWVKVLEVSEEESPDGRPRHKIRLSMKDASQDGSAQDLGAISQANEQASHALESNLNSTIGMGFARDPMAGYSSGSRLVMKHEKKRDAQVINGYALVDDTEGELAPEPPSAAPVNVNVNVNVAAPMAPKAPLGRGRGTTLPAWMTKQDDDEDPIKTNKGRTTTRRDADTERKKTSRNEKIARNILLESTTIVLVKAAANGPNGITVRTKMKKKRDVIANGKPTDVAGVVARILRKIEIARDGGIAIATSKAMDQRENEEIAVGQGRIEINSATPQMTGFRFKALRKRRNS